MEVRKKGNFFSCDAVAFDFLYSFFLLLVCLSFLWVFFFFLKKQRLICQVNSLFKKQGWAGTLGIKICEPCSLLLCPLHILWGFVNFVLLDSLSASMREGLPLAGVPFALSNPRFSVL